MDFVERPANNRSLALRKPVYGFGINDSKYITSYTVNNKKIVCPFYARWKEMIKRCYSVKFHKIQPTYKNCSVCGDWLTFSCFKVWMKEQDWQGKQLDKDLINIGNKIYSPDNCIFISSLVNSLLGDYSASNGKYPQGVHLNHQNNKFAAKVNRNMSQKYLGIFNTISEASDAYIKAKRDYIFEVASTQTEYIKQLLIVHANNLDSLKGDK